MARINTHDLSLNNNVATKWYKRLYYLNVIVARMDTRDGLGNIRIAINKTFTSICLVKLLLLQE